MKRFWIKVNKKKEEEGINTHHRHLCVQLHSSHTCVYPRTPGILIRTSRLNVLYNLLGYELTTCSIMNENGKLTTYKWTTRKCCVKGRFPVDLTPNIIFNPTSPNTFNLILNNPKRLFLPSTEPRSLMSSVQRRDASSIFRQMFGSFSEYAS